MHILHIRHILYSESLFNKIEDFRAKPSSWYAVCWMPIIEESKCLRPGQGYACDAARNLRNHHELLAAFPSQICGDQHCQRHCLR